jgi:hypothetical protein
VDFPENGRMWSAQRMKLFQQLTGNGNLLGWELLLVLHQPDTLDYAGEEMMRFSSVSSIAFLDA